MQLQTLVCKLLQHCIAECDPHYNSEEERGWLAFIAISANLLCELFSAEWIILPTVLFHISLVLGIINNKPDLENASGASSSITHCHCKYCVHKSSVAQYLKWNFGKKTKIQEVWQSMTNNNDMFSRLSGELQILKVTANQSNWKWCFSSSSCHLHWTATTLKPLA